MGASGQIDDDDGAEGHGQVCPACSRGQRSCVTCGRILFGDAGAPTRLCSRCRGGRARCVTCKRALYGEAGQPALVCDRCVIGRPKCVACGSVAMD
jgi:hypothetical protein